MAMQDPRYGEALSMMDIARLTGADKKYLPIIEIMNKSNPIVEDLLSIQANSGMVHEMAVRTSLPHGTFRMFYQGTPTEKSTTAQIRESCSLLETNAIMDKALIDIHANRGNIMLSQSKAFIEGLGQTQARTIFYGNSSINPNEYRGLATRYDRIELNDTDSPFYNVIDAGGTGDNLSSMWIISFGADKIHGIYPTGSVSGLQHIDMPMDYAYDSTGKKFLAYRQHYSWRWGLAVPDWRYAVRIANVDIASLQTAGTSAYSGPDLGNIVWDAIERLPNDGRDGTFIYCSPKVWTAFQKMAANKFNLALSLQEWNGRILPAVNSMMLKRCDAILEHEAHVPLAA